jgi:hypothetical protein
LLCWHRFEFADEKPDGVLPRLIRIAAKAEVAAEYVSAACDIDIVEAKTAYQAADLVDLTDQHPIGMHQARQIAFATVAFVERCRARALSIASLIGAGSLIA